MARSADSFSPPETWQPSLREVGQRRIEQIKAELTRQRRAKIARPTMRQTLRSKAKQLTLASLDRPSEQLGIGPVRMLYYGALIHSCEYIAFEPDSPELRAQLVQIDEQLERLNLIEQTQGLTERLLMGRVQLETSRADSLRHLQERQELANIAKQESTSNRELVEEKLRWVETDIFLEGVLFALGLDWWQIERVMWDAFRRVYHDAIDPSLANELPNLTPQQKGRLDLSCIEAWYLMRSSIEVYRRTSSNTNVRNLMRKVLEVAYDPEADAVLGQAITSALKSKSHEFVVANLAKLPARYANFRTVNESPFLTPIVQALVTELFRGVNRETDTEPLTPDVARIVLWCRSPGDVVPLDFWNLVARIINHLLIVTGVPNSARWVVPTSTIDGESIEPVSALAVKKRCGSARELREMLAKRCR